MLGRAIFQDTDYTDKIMKKIIGMIGCGNMGSAICQRLKDFYDLAVFDKDANKTNKLTDINVASNIADLAKKSDVIILAVKPQDFDNLLADIKNYIKDKLLISIAAGITTNYIEKKISNVRVIRVMPNMPAKIGKGMSCLCKGKVATEDDLNFVKQLFDNLGETLILNEDMMDAATAISGSGPGYLYYLSENKSMDEIKKFANEVFISSLRASAESIGFSLKQADILARTTVLGGIALIEQTKLAPSELKKQIASKGGTTEAGLEVLHKGGSLKDAVRAALKRAKELSRG